MSSSPRILLIVLFVAAASGCTVTESVMSPPSPNKPEFYSSPEAAAKNWPFSQAVRAGDYLFLAGQLGTGADGRLVSGGIVPESRQMMENIKAVLDANGAALGDVVKCTVFLADMAEWPTFNGVYTSFFQKPYPARSALGAGGLALGARVEVECIAYLPRAR